MVGHGAVDVAVLVVSCPKCGFTKRHPCTRELELQFLTLQQLAQRNAARIVELEYAVELLKTALAGVVA